MKRILAKIVLPAAAVLVLVALVLGMMLYTIAVRLTGTGCSVISVDSVGNEDRATAQNLCAAFRSILSMVAPLVAAPLVTAFGGMTMEGIRPLYAIRFIGYTLVFLLVATRLTDVTNGSRTVSSPGLRQEIRQLFEGSAPLRKWVVISSTTYLPMAMTLPFMQVFAHQVKGANQYVLGAMATATILAQLAFGIPLGRLADRIGRKKVIYLLAPLWYASHLLLIFSFSPVTLILAGALWTFYYIDSGVSGAMALELVPVEEMGRWSGLQALFRGMVAIPAPILAGVIWERLGPSYVFLVPLAVDLLIRIPLLTTVPETLHMTTSEP